MEAFYLPVLAAIGLALIPGFVATFYQVGQYGRHDHAPTGVRLPTRAGWFVMEAPALMIFVSVFAVGPYASNPISIVLFLLWVIHYVHRVCIYPLQIVVRRQSTLKGSIILQGFLFCAANGFVNAMWIAHIHLYAIDSATFVRLAVGALIFIAGFYLNKRYDFELIRLRKANPAEYGFCNRGLFKYVACPNYLGEIVTWSGFAIAAWSLPSLLFLLMTVINLVPRAVKHLRWYQDRFPDYGHRKAIIPFLW